MRRKMFISLLTVFCITVGILAAPIALSEEPVTFKFIQAQPEYQTAAQALVKAYMDEFPHITIELLTTLDTLSADLQAGNIPEIFYSEGYAQLDYYADYIEDLSDQPWVDMVNNNALAAITKDEKIYGFPTTYCGEGIVYNKKMFEEHGWEVPSTISGLRELCKTIQAAGITPFVNQFGDGWLIGQLMSGAAYTYIPDTQAFTDALYAGEASFADNEQMQGLFSIIDLMLENGLPDPLSYSWNEACAAFAMGEVAMIFEGDWIWSTIEPIDPSIECAMFPVPISDNEGSGKILFDVNMVLHVGKGSNEPEAAKEFLRWMTSSDTAKSILLKDYQFIPCIKGWEFAGTNQLAMSAAEHGSRGAVSPWWWQRWPTGFRENAGSELQNYISGDISAKEALEAIDALWDNLTGK
ncbi:MAG: ABC transporter substrate-binding protein [Christensenellales bacterium]|jgi:raffinose/stachyose/melibiose transport system substrate-binding protein